MRIHTIVITVEYDTELTIEEFERKIADAIEDTEGLLGYTMKDCKSVSNEDLE